MKTPLSKESLFNLYWNKEQSEQIRNLTAKVMGVEL